MSEHSAENEACNHVPAWKRSVCYHPSHRAENDTPDMDDFEFTLTRRALRQIKAEVWEEGYLAGQEAEVGQQDGNPYRPIPPEGGQA